MRLSLGQAGGQDGCGSSTLIRCIISDPLDHGQMMCILPGGGGCGEQECKIDEHDLCVFACMRCSPRRVDGAQPDGEEPS